MVFLPIQIIKKEPEMKLGKLNALIVEVQTSERVTKSSLLSMFPGQKFVQHNTNLSLFTNSVNATSSCQA